LAPGLLTVCRIARAIRSVSLRRCPLSRRRALVPALALTTLFTALPGGAAEASLIDYGGGLIYDDVQDLTWLDPSVVRPPADLVQNLQCQGAPCHFNYTWLGATMWTGSLRYEGYDDWRLPGKLEPGVFGGDNELHRMLAQVPGWQFGALGNGEYDLLTTGQRGPFQAAPAYWFVWMSEPYAYTSGAAGGGYDFPDDPDRAERNVIAVRKGRPSSTVPEPSTLAALAIGAAAFIGLRRRWRS
jgi:hypothetical protein